AVRIELEGYEPSVHPQPRSPRTCISTSRPPDPMLANSFRATCSHRRLLLRLRVRQASTNGNDFACWPNSDMRKSLNGHFIDAINASSNPPLLSATRSGLSEFAFEVGSELELPRQLMER